MNRKSFPPRNWLELSVCLLVVGTVAAAGCTTSKSVRPAGSKRAAMRGRISDYMDAQAQELSAIAGARTKRIGDEIKITWPSAFLFDFDSAMLKLASRESIEQVGGVFQRYPDTDILIAGHTDNSGSEEHNLKLSARRAHSVRDYLIAMGVDAKRLQATGYGGLYPVADSTSDTSRHLNRRIEIEIRPNEVLLQRAKQKAKS